MKLASCSQMREIDRAAIEEYKIPGIVLMENAALSVFRICAGLDAYAAKKAVIFCGGGNNGGDGFAVARHMHNDGADVTVILAASPERIKGDAKINYDICINMHMNVLELTDSCLDEIRKLTSSAPLIIDAMLGTGVSGHLRGIMRDAVELINKSEGFVLAVDCPTGGNPDSGEVSDVCIRADLTVTLELYKPGLLLYPLADYTGAIEIGPIGAPSSLTESFETNMYCLDTKSAAALLPKRKERSHKGTYGKAAIVAGGYGMAGAAAFCARAAYRAGCGYVSLCAPKSVTSIIQQLEPQAVITPLPEKNGFVFIDSAEPALKSINAATVCLIGPGLGNTEETNAFIRYIIENAEVPLIIDADALNAVSCEPDILREAAYPPVVTPHPLEMSRLTQLPVGSILENMVKTANEFSEQYNCITVLKDATTVISFNGIVYLNAGGCSALAKAGSGDILAGIIAGLMAQGASGQEASALAAFIHSKSGKYAAEVLGGYSVLCPDIINSMSKVLSELERH